MKLAMATALASVVVACGSKAPPEAPVAGGAAVAGPDAVDRVIAAVRARAHVPGMAVAIVRDGVADVRTAGVASLEWDAPVTRRTAFQIASSTKVFTGTLVLLLVQDGLLALDQPVSAYLADAPPAWRAMTVAQLAAHASGIADLDDLRTPGDAARAYRDAREPPLRTAPGAAAAYGRTDFAVLQVLLERVSGQPFEALLAARILAPLGLTCTGFEHATDDDVTRRGDVIAARAGVYRWADGQQRTAGFLYPSHGYASGGLWSCVDDLVRWAQALDDGRLLDPALEARAATPLALTGGGASPWSVAFATGTLHGLPWYGHSGGPALADVVRVPSQRLTVIVLANQQRLAPTIAPLLASLALGAAPPPAPTAAALARPVDRGELQADRALLIRLADGTVPDTRYAPAARPLAAELRTWLPLYAAAWPELTAVTLIDRRVEPDGGEVRVYAARYGTRVGVRWTVTRDSAGALTGADLTIE